MTMLRGLPSLAARRIADSTCDVIYNTLTPDDDGSSTVTTVILTLKASIKPLQPVDIKRLREGGIEVQEGVSILISEALEERPEQIEADGKKWRILSWSFIPAYENESGNPIGTVVAACDEIRVEPAEV
ncbi:MAG: hypothetical protein WC374_07260 [Phycisphaerae bacterium]|jgi:hypothetical protein